ncbi:MAG: hypothetical protein WBW04_03785 [Nitrolancea sp.]
MTQQPDVIVAGAGYAGLAAAIQLGARALVIDQHDVGAVQRSACAVPVVVVERFGATDAIIQRYDAAFFHDARGTHRFDLKSPYCIINHRRFCRLLWEQSEAGFVKARIRSFTGRSVLTKDGQFEAPLFIDATGWPGMLSAPGRSAIDRKIRLTPAIEADVPGTGEGLHIHYVPRIVPKGYGWVFPAGDELRVGVGSYDRSVDLKQSLNGFLDYLGLQGSPARGGMIPWFSANPVIGNVFAAGDAAGHCLPLTVEGIRMALGFGDAAGRTIKSVVDGSRSLEAAAEEYRTVCYLHRRSFTAMRLSQHLVGPTPDLGIHLIARGLRHSRIKRFFLHTYFSLGAAPGRAA